MVGGRVGGRYVCMYTRGSQSEEYSSPGEEWRPPGEEWGGLGKLGVARDARLKIELPS